MAKKRETTDTDSPAQVSQPTVVVSPFLRDVMRNNEALFGERSFMASDAERFAIGFPLPHLSLMYLFGLTIYPLSKDIGIAGKPASCKSSLGFYFMKLACDYGGYSHLVECESGKFSPNLIRSIIGDKHIQQGRMSMTACNSIDEAQTCLTKYTDSVMAQDPMRSIPFAFVVDSLTGSEVESESEKVNKEGSAMKAFPIGALSWTRFFKIYSSRLIGWPISFVFLAHLKDKPPPPGMGHLPPQKTTPGGVAQDFHASIYLHTTLIKDGRTATRDIVGDTIDCPSEFRRLKLFTQKNSLAPGKRSIVIDFIWYYSEDGTQQSYFDFETATAELVASMQSGESDLSSPERKALKEICDLTCVKNQYYSDRLGLDGVNGVTAGHTIESDPELMEALIKFFHISRYPVLPKPELDANGIPIPKPKPLDRKEKIAQNKAAKAQQVEAPPLPQPQETDPTTM